MTTLATPPTWDQFLDQGGQTAADPGYVYRNSCGAHATASSLVGGGLLPAATALVTVEADIGVGDTQTQQLVDELHKHGASGAAQAAGYDQVIDAGRYAIVLVQSDGSGHPVPRGTTNIEHWVTAYANDGGVIRIANSGSGQDESYAAADFARFYAGITIDSGCAPPGGYVMDSAKEESLDQETAWKTFEGVLGRNADPDSFAWALGVARKSHTDLLWAVINGPEYKAGGGVLGWMARTDAELAAIKAELGLDEQQLAKIAAAGQVAVDQHVTDVTAAVVKLQAEMGAISKAAAS